MSGQKKRMEDPRPAELLAGDLRKVELDVVIPKKMKLAAMEKCAEAIKAFSECCMGRTVSITWACRDQNNAVDDCLRSHMTDSDYAREKQIYLHDRDEHRQKQSSYPDDYNAPNPTTEKYGGAG